MNRFDDKERIDLLRDIVANGKEAEKAKVFVDNLIEEAKTTLIDSITKSAIESKEVMKAAYDFRAVYFLSVSINTLIKKGVEKEKKLQELLNN